jgi:threonine synthase
MDILISSNLERMLYYVSEGDTELISSLMKDLSDTGRYEIPANLKTAIDGIFAGGWADEDQVKAAIRECWGANHYVIDPHTACGYHVMTHTEADPLTPRVLLSTASPYKFPRVVNEALGLDTPASDFACMDVLAETTGTTAPKALRALESAEIRFHDVIDIDGMSAYVESVAERLNQ